ncbi:30S ribosomal protein S21 [Neorickettsia helminthoeca]|nr:30S ribosomal protein S21 [Neorickettsia helminthoeca]
MGQVFMVHHGDVEQALRRLKQHLSREGVTPGRKRVFEKPSEKRHRRAVEIKRKIRKQRMRATQ